MQYFYNCWKLWGFPWTAQEMTYYHYHLLIALEELSKEDFANLPPEKEWIENYKKRREERLRQRQTNEEQEKERIKEVQDQIKKQIIDQREKK